MANQLVSKKARYNLSFVIRETGIKADTLRAWERRYHLPQPKRTEGGHRLFSDFDIETIKWLIARQKEGMSISQAVGLWREIESSGQDPPFLPPAGQSTNSLTATTAQGGESLAIMRNRWIQACLDFNEPAAEQVLTQSFAQFPLETVCVEILQSGLAEIGTLWYQGVASVQQEHFASELAVRRLHSLILAAPQPIRSQTILVGCPQGENHTISALLLTLLLRYRSWNVIYLGGNIPRGHLRETIEKTRPDLVIMTSMRLITAASLYDTAVFLKELDIPMAFGGWIYNQIPTLSQSIPGHYLGDELIAAISSIENLLTGPMPPIESGAEPDRFSEPISHFIEKKHLIEVQTLKDIKSKIGRNIPLKYFQEANDYLAEDIIAALSLGDLSLAGSNITWVESLMANRDVSDELLVNYLLAYYHAAQTHLDKPGLPVIDWLASIIQIKL
jgi:DNA-binding transcriptional MerR regulator